jgi:hypothetical protein
MSTPAVNIMDIEVMEAILYGPANNLTSLAADFAALASRPDRDRDIVPIRVPSYASDASPAVACCSCAQDGPTRLEQNG